MAWIVTLDGTNDYFDIGSTVTASTNSYIEIKFRVESTAGDSFLRLASDTISGSSTDRVIVESNGDRVIVNSGGGTNATWSSVFGGALSTGQVITVKVVTSGTASKELFVDGVSKGTATTNFSSLGRWRYFGVNFSSYSNISYYYIDFTDNNTPSNSSYWDATASSHGAGTPVLTDTAGSRNATGVNMLTDGSVWTDLGSGSTPITTQSSGQSQSSENATLLAKSFLTIATSSQAQSSENVALLAASFLTVDTSSQEQSSENVTLSASGSISVQDSFQAQSSESVTFSVSGSISAQDSLQSQYSENTTLSVAGNVNPQNSFQSQLSENVTLSVPGSSIVVSNSEQAQRSEAVTLLTKSILSVDTSRQTQFSQSVNFGGVIYSLDGQILLNVKLGAKLSSITTITATILING